MNNYSESLINDIKKVIGEIIINQFRNVIGRFRENLFEQQKSFEQEMHEQQKLFEQGMHEQQKSFEQGIQEIKTIIIGTISPSPNTRSEILETLRDFNQNILNYQSSLTNTNSSINKVHQKFNSIDNVLMNTNNSINQVHRKINSFENELTNISNSINQISQKYNFIDNVPTIPNNSTEHINHKVDSFEQILISTNNSINQIHQKFNSFDNTLADQNSLINQIHQKFNSFENILTNPKDSTEHINQQLNYLEQILTNTSGSINQVNKKIESIDTILTNTKNTNNSISQLNKKIKSIDTILANTTNTNNSINQVHNKIKSINTILTNPENSIESIKQKLNSFEQVLTNTDISITQFQQTFTSFDNTIMNIKNTLEQVLNNLNSLPSKVEDASVQNNAQLFQNLKRSLDRFGNKFNEIKESMSEIFISNLTNINTSITKVADKTTEIYSNSFSIKNLNVGIRLKDSNNKNIHSILELPNERIAAGTNEDIYIWKINLVKNISELIVQKKKAHLKFVSSLCNLSESRMASSSEDTLIKIWKLKEDSLKFIGKIDGNSSCVKSIIPIIYDKKEFIVSCVPEKSYIKIWGYELKDDGEFKSEEIQTLSKDNKTPRSVIEIKSKNILVSSWTTSSESKNSCLILHEFYEAKYKEKNKLEFVYSENKGIVQVNDNYIAVLNEYVNPPEINLIDLTNFTIQKRINDSDIKQDGSLTRINDYSFIYSNVGVVYQIVRGINNDYFKIVSQIKNIDLLDGRKGIIVSKGGKYIYGVDITDGIFLINVYY